mmetsp:Transcript_41323/g.118885  ORF Transcript_41323/g.118885 Transcript_41323/m.118885 type:complete len:235 (+) Transcript_41323:121-825(+)
MCRERRPPTSWHGRCAPNARRWTRRGRCAAHTGRRSPVPGGCGPGRRWAPSNPRSDSPRTTTAATHASARNPLEREGRNKHGRDPPSGHRPPQPPLRTGTRCPRTPPARPTRSRHPTSRPKQRVSPPSPPSSRNRCTHLGPPHLARGEAKPSRWQGGTSHPASMRFATFAAPNSARRRSNQNRGSRSNRLGETSAAAAAAPLSSPRSMRGPGKPGASARPRHKAATATPALRRR